MFFGAAAAILSGAAFLLDGVAARTNTWASPHALLEAAVCCLALHVIGFGTRPPRP